MSEEKKKAEQIAILFCAETDVIKPNFSSIKQAKKHVNEILNSDPNFNYPEYDYNKHKLGVDDEFWNGVLTELNKM